MISDKDIAQAVAVLQAGGLVAFPTETVYGLGADASNPDAVAKIYAAKGRPADHPLIVHLADAVQLPLWARQVPRAAHALAKAYWPGPLTLILKRGAAVLDAVTGGQDTVALRVPSHPAALAVLRAFGRGIAAPSANRYGRVSATTAQHVRQEFGPAVECVLDGGACDLGIESTIIDLSCAAPTMLRPGHITAGQVEAAIGRRLAAPNAQAPRAPGTLAKHYAPHTPVMLLEPDLVIQLAASLTRQGQRVAVLARSAQQPVLAGLTWMAAPSEAQAYGHDLYANLRALDEAGCDALLVEEPPLAPAWVAVRDRLNRAAAGSADEDET